VELVLLKVAKSLNNENEVNVCFNHNAMQIDCSVKIEHSTFKKER
jgi:hypothetical protein